MELTENQKLYTEVIQKAWEDADFKKALTQNPIEAIENFIGKKISLPEGKTLVVRDQTDVDAVYINIPAKSEINSELTEEQLEAVSGGVGVRPILGFPPFGPGPCFPIPDDILVITL